MAQKPREADGGLYVKKRHGGWTIYIPSPATIAAECQKFQAGWTPADRIARSRWAQAPRVEVREEPWPNVGDR